MFTAALSGNRFLISVLLLGVDRIENSLSIVAYCAEFTKLLPGNGLISSVALYISLAA
jgi:hypothetical protein